jgi:hypothetical protein
MDNDYTTLINVMINVVISAVLGRDNKTYPLSRWTTMFYIFFYSKKTKQYIPRSMNITINFNTALTALENLFATEPIVQVTTLSALFAGIRF